MPGLGFIPGQATSWIDKRFGRKLLETGFSSDFTIKCRGEEWKVHKEILADRSDYFHRLFDGNWKECTEGFVDFDDEPEVVRIVIEFIYTLEFDTTPEKGSHEKEFCRRAGITTFNPLANPDGMKWRNGYGYWWPIAARDESDAIHIACVATQVVLVHAMSDRLGIMVSRDTGVSRMYSLHSWRWTTWFDELSYCSMHEVLSLAFEVLASERESGLRAWLVTTCMRNAEIIKANPDIVALLEREEPKAWSTVA